MASHNGSFNAWMVGLVSGIDKLNVTADSTFDDFFRWKLDIFKVLEEQGILHYVDGTSRPSPDIHGHPDAEKALALALLFLTLDEHITDKLYSPDNPEGIYDQLRIRYLDWIEEEKFLRDIFGHSMVHMRQVHSEKKEVLEKTIKQKKEELADLEIEVAALERAIEQTYAPESPY